MALIFSVLGPALPASILAMKQTGGWPRTSLGQALLAALLRLRTWPWRWRDPRRALLLGMQSLFLAPFFRLGIYVPGDCWSARESALAARHHGMRWVLRTAYAAAIGLAEAILVRFVARILVVSREEQQHYLARYPWLAGRVMILPLRMPPIAARADPRPPSLDCNVAIWMDGRVGYGLESIADCLACIEPWPDLSVTILSRREDLGLPLGPKQRNLVFVDDLDAFLRQQSLVILPDTFGSGIKNRALEVAARGIPLLATPIALEGFGWVPARSFVLTYDAADSFQSAMAEFQRDGGTARAQALLDRLAEEAVDYEAKLLSLARLSE